MLQSCGHVICLKCINDWETGPGSYRINFFGKKEWSCPCCYARYYLEHKLPYSRELCSKCKGNCVPADLIELPCHNKICKKCLAEWKDAQRQMNIQCPCNKHLVPMNSVFGFLR